MPSRRPRKVRDGSVLKEDKPFAQQPDLRGHGAKLRDAELISHFGRLARLDWVEQIAKEKGHEGWLDRIDMLRRNETKRHHLAMMRLRRQFAGQNLEVSP